MLVADTSALISLAVGDVLDTVLDEFDVVTTDVVVTELRETAAYEDVHGDAATTVLAYIDDIERLDVDGSEFVSSRVDEGEASCTAAVRAVDAPFLLTDDFRALPELQVLIDGDVALSPIVLRALVKRGTLTSEEANRTLDAIATDRDWLGAPIYRYARQLLEDKTEE